MKKLLLTALILTSCIVLLSGCGNDAGIDLGPGGCVTAPTGSKILFVSVPSEVTCAVFTRKTGTFTIQVVNENGIPLNDVLLWIDYPWAVPHEPGFVQFNDGNTPKNAPMNACTDVDGLFHLTVDYDCGGDSYDGSLTVTSGGISETSDFGVK